MSSSNREVAYVSVNKHGNVCKTYTDGSYAYTNYNSRGQVTGRYFNTGSNHAFYNPTWVGRAAGHQG